MSRVSSKSSRLASGLAGSELGWNAEPSRERTPLTHCHVDAALGHLVEHGDVFGEADGVPVGQEIGALAETDAGGAACEVGAHEDGVGELVHALGAHVVLAYPGGVETGLFAEYDLFAEVVD